MDLENEEVNEEEVVILLKTTFLKGLITNGVNWEF